VRRSTVALAALLAACAPPIYEGQTSGTEEGTDNESGGLETQAGTGGSGRASSSDGSDGDSDGGSGALTRGPGDGDGDGDSGGPDTSAGDGDGDGDGDGEGDSDSDTRGSDENTSGGDGDGDGCIGPLEEACNGATPCCDPELTCHETLPFIGTCTLACSSQADCAELGGLCLDGWCA